MPLIDETRYIKIAKKVFRYAWIDADSGWSHDVYYDTVSKDNIIFDFPGDPYIFDVSELPKGRTEIETNDKKYQIKLYER